MERRPNYHTDNEGDLLREVKKRIRGTAERSPEEDHAAFDEMGAGKERDMIRGINRPRRKEGAEELLATFKATIASILTLRIHGRSKDEMTAIILARLEKERSAAVKIDGLFSPGEHPAKTHLDEATQKLTNS